MEFTFPLLFLLSCACVALSPAMAADTPVLDVAGNPIVVGVQYYVLLHVGGNLGTKSINDLCPVNVYRNNFPYGNPVTFIPQLEERADSTILLEELLLINFTEATGCPESLQWTVNDTTGLVVTGGAPPSSDSGYNYYGYFRIAEYEILGPGTYQIYSCPTPIVQRPCSTLGLNEEGLFGRNPRPLIVKFEKNPWASAGSSAVHPSA